MENYLIGLNKELVLNKHKGDPLWDYFGLRFLSAEVLSCLSLTFSIDYL